MEVETSSLSFSFEHNFFEILVFRPFCYRQYQRNFFEILKSLDLFIICQYQHNFFEILKSLDHFIINQYQFNFFEILVVKRLNNFKEIVFDSDGY